MIATMATDDRHIRFDAPTPSIPNARHAAASEKKMERRDRAKCHASFIVPLSTMIGHQPLRASALRSAALSQILGGEDHAVEVLDEIVE